jgi:hypothetical protein
MLEAGFDAGRDPVVVVFDGTPDTEGAVAAWFLASRSAPEPARGGGLFSLAEVLLLSDWEGGRVGGIWLGWTVLVD